MRTFVAIDLPQEIRDRIRQLLQALRTTATHVRWSRPENLHITLKFLGEVSAPTIPEVEACLRSIRLSDTSLPLEVKVQGSGFFPNERSPRVIWLGVHAEPALAGLVAQVDQALLSLGFAKEDRPFSPHLTLGRIREPGPLSALREYLQQRAPLEVGSFVPQDFALYESQLAPGGSIYRTMARFPLAGASHLQ